MITLGDLTGFRKLIRNPCLGKVVFQSVEHAQARVDRLVALGLHRPHLGTLHPYPCSRCGRIHMGHSRGIVLPNANSGTISF